MRNIQNVLKVRLYPAIIILLTIFITIACNNEPEKCPDNQTPYFKVALFKYLETDTLNFTVIRIHNADVFLEGNEELNDTLYSNFDFPTLWGMPVNNLTDSLSLIIERMYVDTSMIASNKSFDTLHIKYNFDLYLENLECDFFLEYTIDSLDYNYTMNQIDSVSFKNYKINDEQNTNVEIYF